MVTVMVMMMVVMVMVVSRPEPRLSFTTEPDEGNSNEQ